MPKRDAKTVSDDDVQALKDIQLEIAASTMRLEQQNRAMRDENARRQRLGGVRASLMRRMGLDHTKFYKWEAARLQGRQVPIVLTEEDIEKRIKEQRAHSMPVRVPDSTPVPSAAVAPGAAPTPDVAAAPAVVTEVPELAEAIQG